MLENRHFQFGHFLLVPLRNLCLGLFLSIFELSLSEEWQVIC